MKYESYLCLLMFLLHGRCGIFDPEHKIFELLGLTGS